MEWNPKAIDYEAGIDIYDPETGKIYTDVEARLEPSEIRRRLLIKPRKIGCWVLDLNDLERIRNEKRNKRSS